MHAIKNLLCIDKFLSLILYSLILIFNLLIFKCNLIMFNNSSLVLYLLTLLLNLIISFYFNLFIKKMLSLLSIIKSIFFKAVCLLLSKF